MTEVVTLGETMAMITSDTGGPLAHARSLGLSVGGAESNVAIGLSRLGVGVTWIGRVGADSLGEKVLRELRAERVALSAVEDETAPTGLMIKERRTHRHLQVSYYRSGSAGSRLSRADVPADLVRGARLLHVTGITPALSSSAADTVRYAVGLAKEAGVNVSFDVNHRSRLWSAETAALVYAELVAAADIVFAGDDEAALVVGSGTPAELADRLAALGPEEVVIKLGERGAHALVGGVHLDQDAVAVEAVDTVGAGDAFVAGYLAERLAGRSVPERLVTAATAGAFACLVAGDWEGSPRRSELTLLASVEPVRR